jgi:hypothetical protein
MVGAAISMAAVPALGQGFEVEATPAPESVAADSDAPPVVSKLELNGGFKWVSHRFFYTDNFRDRLRTYEMGLAPAPYVSAEWYPGGNAIGGPKTHLGIIGSFEQSLSWQSKRASGERFETSMNEWQLGVRGRMPLIPHQAGLSLTFGSHTFSVDDDPRAPLVPDMSYKFIRLGVDGRASFGEISVGGRLAYRFILDAGDVVSDIWFPRASVGGLDLGAYVAYALMPELDVVAGIDYRRYFYTLNPEPGDRRVAGGALDQYVSPSLGISVRLGADEPKK